ncbi:MAG TPA: NADP-dependent oxidoreductase [Nocardioidaceae bacterium]|nr:NADP-dependent oxidoreductase [Nocardioidaceae bacterium]
MAVRPLVRRLRAGQGDGMTMMQAAVTTAAGGPQHLKLRKVPRPEPGLGEVLVQTRAAGVNPVDFYAGMEGELPTGDAPPFVLGWDVAGVVRAVGPGVVRWEVGDEVLGLVRFPAAAGTYAEYVAAPSNELVRKPQGMTFEQAGALPLAGLTAWQALVVAGQVTAGQRVLVHAAAGGVGHLAVQIAKSRAAYVIGTARRGKHAFLRRLGVDQPVDYTDPEAMAAVADVDLVLDTMGGEQARADISRMRNGGRIVTLLPMDPAFPEPEIRAAGGTPYRLLVEPDTSHLEELLTLWRRGQLRIHLDASYPLEETATAHTRGLDGHVTGKLVVTM